MVVKNIPAQNLNETDWKVLRDVIWTFIYVKDPSKVTILNVPDFGSLGGATQYYFKGGLQLWIDNGYLDMLP